MVQGAAATDAHGSGDRQPEDAATPHRVAGTIPRTQLTRALRASQDRVVLVSAPAGYGKTTTIALWEQDDPRPFAWVPLGPADEDPLTLVQRVAEAVARIEPLPDGLTRLLSSAGRVVDTDLLPPLLQEMASRKPFVLVLDDVQYLVSPESLRCVDALLTWMPDRSSIVVAGRGIPELSLSRARLELGVLELTARELAMSRDDAARLLGLDGLDTRGMSLEDLWSLTEGWPAGLRLAGELLKSTPPGESSPFEASRAERWVAQDLVSQVLDRLPVEDVRFMEQSAVLDRMSGQLLDELLDDEQRGGQPSAERLRRLAISGTAFLVPLDEGGEFYRYHALFSQELLARLHESDSPGAITLHRRASEILRARGDIDGAVRQAHSGGDPSAVADLCLVHAVQMAFGGRSSQLRSWLGLLDPPEVVQFPAASIALAWAAIADGEGLSAAEAAVAAERSGWVGPLADGSPSVEVAVSAIRATMGMGGVEQVIADGDRARRGGGPDVNPWWGLATLMQGTALEMRGDFDQARVRFNEALPEMLHLPTYEAGAQGHLALLALYEGDLVEADRRATKALSLIESHHLEAVVPMAHPLAVGALLAGMDRRTDDQQRLSLLASRLLARMGDLSPRTSLMCHVLLAKAAMTSGGFEDAGNHLIDAERARQIDSSAVEVCEQMDRLVGQLAEQRDVIAPGSPALTSAELRVLEYLPTHYSRRGIAERIHVSHHTVKSHTVSIYRKLGVASRNDAVEVAKHVGLLQDLRLQPSEAGTVALTDHV